ncbi:glycoside hydrolase family 92 protein [Flavobacterium cupreum]|uniref:Alpha-1,2-mannosidase n=2 Tax=Flavobacterium TaxID=237 RepID=A0A4Y7UDA0_9FLAO|nr:MULTISPECIES: GH92 family glycosyl hydrolase [Flavobacterium]RUT67997.1 glycoside hydrolase family 92 protein [Flavobacterium cupreum]TCN59025.1 putative alpha-1,2-mannosidase [Flavobacterium circumlabens]TEB44423.1 glycoside hydrolase family 92 protein [Flavobacterium circumlabens]
MINYKIKFQFIIIVLLISLQSSLAQSKKQPVDYVDNFIGVRDKNSSCVLGPQLPNGAISPSPQTAPGSVNYDMDGYIMGQPIRGFGQLHVSGTGWGKYGQVFISPQVGLAVGETEHDSQQENEEAKPYEYKVSLSRYGIKTAVTPAAHSAIYKFTFPKSDNSNILLDVSHNTADIATALKLKNGNFLKGTVTFTNSDGTEINGYGEYQGGFSDGTYKVFFSMKLSKIPQNKGTFINGKINQGQLTEAPIKADDRIGAYVQYKTSENESVYLKVAVSMISVEQATAWLDAEIPAWDYNKVRDNAKKIWNKELGKIKMEGGTESEKRIFYTASYHTSIMPRNKTNDMMGFEKGESVWDDHLAVWDTWRTLYPLKVLTNPDMVSGTINSFIARLKKNGRVKDAYVAGKDMTAEQGGNNIDNIIADAYVKGVKGVDWKEAYKLIKSQADNERNGIGKNENDKIYKTLGWIPGGKMSCSLTLEYAYNDFCAAQMARTLGTKEDYEKYLNRSQQWVNLWNPEAVSDGYKGFIEPKNIKGDFIPIDLKKNWGSWQDYFYEGSSWTYSYFVPHQFEKLVTISGGKELFAKKLQYAFENNLIDYGNEPAFLAVHSFHYADRSDLASFYIRNLKKKRFTEEGSIENDDSGAMSSWYIFSSLGFFPNAGQDIYYLTGGSFPKVAVTLGNGKVLTVTSKNASEKNIYIQSCKINGKVWNNPWFTHKEIENGGTIEFVMGENPVFKK